MKKKFLYNSGIAACDIYYKGNILSGTAVCHLEDKDMESERTGLTIAEARANIKYMKHVRDNEIKPQITAIKHLCCCIEQSKSFNSKSYEAKMIYRQLHNLQKQLDTINSELAGEQKYLHDYIVRKELIHNRIRAKKSNLS